MRRCVVPFGPSRVCGPGLAAILATRGGRVQSMVFAPLFAALVAGVGEEPAHLLLAGLTLLHPGLDPGQHAVQGRAEPAHLAAGMVRGDPVGEVTGGDPVGLSGHRLDRAQAAAQHDEDAEADEQHHGDRAQQDDELDPHDGLVHLVEAGAHDQGSAGGAQGHDAHIRRPVRSEQGVRAGSGGDLGRAGRQGPADGVRPAVRGYLQGHLRAAKRQEHHVVGAGQGRDLFLGRRYPTGRATRWVPAVPLPRGWRLVRRPGSRPASAGSGSAPPAGCCRSG